MNKLVLFFFALVSLTFVSCHDDDDKEILKLFTPFAKSDTCFTATVKIWPSDGVVDGYGSVDLTFDIDEKTCGKDLQFLDSKHDVLWTRRLVYNTGVLPRNLKNGDRIKFRILAYCTGYLTAPELADGVTQNFIIKMCE